MPTASLQLRSKTLNKNFRTWQELLKIQFIKLFNVYFYLLNQRYFNSKNRVKGFKFEFKKKLCV